MPEFKILLVKKKRWIFFFKVTYHSGLKMKKNSAKIRNKSCIYECHLRQNKVIVICIPLLYHEITGYDGLI